MYTTWFSFIIFRVRGGASSTLKKKHSKSSKKAKQQQQNSKKKIILPHERLPSFHHPKLIQLKREGSKDSS